MTPSQLAKLRELLQRRILVADNPLVECYQVLRILNPYSTTYTLDSFCLSLQLAILHAQALELIKDSTGLGPISVDHQGDKRLLVKYWVKSDDGDCTLVVTVCSIHGAKLRNCVGQWEGSTDSFSPSTHCRSYHWTSGSIQAERHQN